MTKYFRCDLRYHCNGDVLGVLLSPFCRSLDILCDDSFGGQIDPQSCSLCSRKGSICNIGCIWRVGRL